MTRGLRSIHSRRQYSSARRFELLRQQHQELEATRNSPVRGELERRENSKGETRTDSRDSEGHLSNSPLNFDVLCKVPQSPVPRNSCAMNPVGKRVNAVPPNYGEDRSNAKFRGSEHNPSPDNIDVATGDGKDPIDSGQVGSRERPESFPRENDVLHSKKRLRIQPPREEGLCALESQPTGAGNSNTISPTARENQSMGQELASALAVLRSELMGIIERNQEILQRDNANLRRLVAAEFKEMRSMLQKVASTAQNQNDASASTSGSRTALAEWEKKLDELTPYKKQIFTGSLFSKVLAYNVPLTVVSICSAFDAESFEAKISLHACAMALCTLLFSLKPNQSRNKLVEGVGKLHSDFKLSVVNNTFFNVQRDTFGLFQNPVAVPTSDVPGVAVVGTPAQERWKIQQPTWLRPGFVCKAAVTQAKTFIESKLPKRNRIKDTPARSDVAAFGAMKVSRLLISHLHDGRERVRTTFFQDLGFLLVDWSTLVTDVNQSSVLLEWEDEPESSESGIHLALDEVSVTTTCRHGACSNMADMNNKSILNDLYKKALEMVIVVEHEVFVVTGDHGKGKQRKHSGGTKMWVRRLVNLIEVAMNFCREYTQVSDIWAFLRSHSCALKCAYALSVVFRGLVQSFMSSASLSELKIPQPEEVHAAAVSLDQLLPGRASRVSIMQSRCIRVTTGEYQEINQQVCPSTSQGASTAGTSFEEGGAENQEIDVSMALGVALL